MVIFLFWGLERHVLLLTKNEADLEHEGLGGESAAAERAMKSLSLVDELKGNFLLLLT